jgi:hypothetical protein
VTGEWTATMLGALLEDPWAGSDDPYRGPWSGRGAAGAVTQNGATPALDSGGSLVVTRQLKQMPRELPQPSAAPTKPIQCATLLRRRVAVIDDLLKTVG